MPIHSKNLLRQIVANQQFFPGQLLTELPAGFSRVSSPLRSAAAPERVYWIPLKLPAGKSIFLASSRLDQKLEDKPAWFDALRTFACHVDARHHFLITADRVASDEFVTRIAELFKIPLVRFVPFPEKINEKWICQASTNHASGECRCYYSESEAERRTSKKTQAAKDRLLMLAASEVRVLSCRKSGNTFHSVNERLAASLDTRILIDDQLTPPTTSAHFVESGATAWLLLNGTEEQPRSNPARMNVPILQLDEINTENYLLHWTRRRVGQWPDQTRTQYLDDLIFGTTRAQHDPLAALCRILATDRIVATNSLTRDPTPVVCMSEVALSQLEELTIFRPHLSRWDFLPYGIAIDKEVLTCLGAKPVIYGQPTDWDEIHATDRPFFQIANSESGKISWRQEQEWRIVGELDLRQVPYNEAIVFVPTLRDAETVSSLSRWPVLVLSKKRTKLAQASRIAVAAELLW